MPRSFASWRSPAPSRVLAASFRLRAPLEKSQSSYRQIAFHDVLIKIRDRTARDDAAAVHHVEVVRHADTEVKILLDQQDAQAAFAFDLQNGFANLVDDIGLNALGGFVEN